MNTIAPLSQAPNGVEIVETAAALARICGAGCGAALWRRPRDPRFAAWIDGAAPSTLPRMREILVPSAIRQAVSSACDASGAAAGDGRDWLIDDVASLAAAFNAICEAPRLRIRLDVVTTDSCRRFHRDAVKVRLVCSYRGTGTQYGVSADGGPPAEVFAAPTGSPLLLRGSLWPEDPPSGLLHRSPPIAQTGETRLLLVIDPIEADDVDAR